MFGYYRVCAAVPRLTVADPETNANEIFRLWQEGASQGAAAVLFPELSLTGSTCGDLFLQDQLLEKTGKTALELVQKTAGCQTLLIFGMPLCRGNLLYNCAVVAQNGAVLGIVPRKTQDRIFAAEDTAPGKTICFAGNDVPFGSDLLFAAGDLFCAALEVGSDAALPVSMAGKYALAGANCLFTPIAAAETAGALRSRKCAVTAQSRQCRCVSVMASAGVTESTTDGVFAGHAFLAALGRELAEQPRFQRQSGLIFADTDLQRCVAERRADEGFRSQASAMPDLFRKIALAPVPESPDLRYAALRRMPFVPEDPELRRERCAEVFAIQCAGLAKRVEHARAKKLVIGISGGLDSTLALLVASECCRMLGRSSTDLLAVTMPGFGTTGRTYQNAVEMCRKLGTELREISIKDACLQHFADIGHDPAVLDVAYENVQARERTQILMDLANEHGGLVVGTGDLSEIALGWSTYNGDHMSMYAVNCDVPKTLIRYLIAHAADQADPELAAILRDVIDTPVSPELLPADASGKIQQKTEELVGPYELHDFFLWHFVRYGAAPEKIAYLAEQTFGETYSAETIRHWLKRFVQRFFQQQFKRSCAPDGPRVGTVALSPRGAWMMPSDASAGCFLEDC